MAETCLEHEEADVLRREGLAGADDLVEVRALRPAGTAAVGGMVVGSPRGESGGESGAGNGAVAPAAQAAGMGGCAGGRRRRAMCSYTMKMTLNPTGSLGGSTSCAGGGAAAGGGKPRW